MEEKRREDRIESREERRRLIEELGVGMRRCSSNGYVMSHAM